MRSLRLLFLCLLGSSLTPILTLAAEKPSQSPQQAVSVAPAVSPFAYGKDSDTVLLLEKGFDAKNRSSYRFVVWARVAEGATLRLWFARSAMPDFADASWQEVALQDVKLNEGNSGVYNMVRQATIIGGSQEQKYLIVRGEAEWLRDGVTQRLFTPPTILPTVKTLWRRSREGSQILYATPSEKASVMQLRFARSATREFAPSEWQTLPMAAARSYSGETTYEAVLPAAPAATPWVKVFADAQLEDGGLHIASPLLMWNGLAFPQPASELRGDICPLHGTSDDVVPIIYGMAMSGGPPGAIYAGCIVGPHSGTHHCNRCDCDWGDFLAETEAARKDKS